VVLRALLRSHSVKRSGFLLDILAAAVRAPDFVSIMLVQGESLLETLVAIAAMVIVHGHREDLPFGIWL
jgi:hypothetical protein